MHLLQEYNPTITYIKGEENTVADANLRLDYCPKTNPHPEDEHRMTGASGNMHLITLSGTT